MDTISFVAIDAHVHFRQDDMLKPFVPLTAMHVARALVMPNTDPPKRIAAQVSAYEQEILDAAGPNSGFEPLMTFYIMPDTTPAMVQEFRKAANYIPIAIAGKVYPKGLTTNAELGVVDYPALFPVFEKMEELGLILCLHGEKPGDEIEGLDREKAFLRILKYIVSTFPGLKVVMEHITTEAAVETILGMSPNVRATITAHHLIITYDDAGGDRLSVYNWCKPVAKMRKDREALVEAATFGNPKFMFGSDSAPHMQEKKRRHDCCAGVYAPPGVALPRLAQLFEERGALDRLPNFAGGFALPFYEILNYLQAPLKEVTLVKEPMIVPDDYHGVIPFLAGKEISWSIKS